MKYVITDHNKICMGSGANHIDLAQAITGNVVSAGHFEILDGKVKVSGRSEWFNLNSKPEDAKQIEEYIGL